MLLLSAYSLGGVLGLVMFRSMRSEVSDLMGFRWYVVLSDVELVVVGPLGLLGLRGIGGLSV